MNRESIFLKIQTLLEKEFEIPKEEITLEAKVLEDLDLDSIDVIDLFVQMQQEIGKKIDPQDFKSVITLGDVVEILFQLATKSDESDSTGE